MITVTFIGISLLLLAGIMTWMNGSAVQTQRSNLFLDSSAAADAATELALSHMWYDFYGQNMGPVGNYTGLMPNQTGWPVQFSYCDSNGVANKTSVILGTNNWQANWMGLSVFGPRYAGLSAYVLPCTVISCATTKNQTYHVTATTQQNFDMAAIPVFQFMAFYNLNMEIDPGATMNLSGPVFSDAGIWARGDATFNAEISAAGTVSTGATNPYVSGKVDSTAATFNQMVTSNASSITMPIGTTNSPAAVQALLGLPSTNVSPYSPSGQTYFVNQADLIISNSPGSLTNLTVYYQDPDATPPITNIPPDMTIITTNGSGSSKTYSTNLTYSFVTNATFYDYREAKAVNAIQVDVGNLNKWLTNSHGGSAYNSQMSTDFSHQINSIYVYNNDPLTSSSMPAVRVTDGATLPPDGLTVVTPDPLYVLGNYNANGSSLNNGTNVANTLPAALIGDSITALSGSWSDANSSSTSLSSRNPTAAGTTINAATFEGIVQSNGGNYSGGVENFIRLLENWSNGSGVTLTYNGSIVVMFPSRFATNQWSYGNYYTAPIRKWAFDLNFTSQKGLPPMTPEVFALVRRGWASY